MSASKVVDLEAIGDLVEDGQSVTLGGSWLSNHPMAAVRQLLRAGRTDLRIVTVVGSIDIELLVAAGAIGHLTYAMVTLEAFGLAPSVRRALERRAVAATEVSGVAILLALEATGRGVPFLPYRGPSGSDLLTTAADWYSTVTCPFTGAELNAVRQLQPDVAIVHALRADGEGNAQWDGTSGPDVEMAKAARRVIVTCEEVVDREQIVATAHMTKLPGFYVDAVVEAPFGAHPTSHIPRYAFDAPWLLDYVGTVGDPDAFAALLDQLRGESERAYRERVLGGRRGDVLRELVAQPQLLERPA